jgi:hypothetical protein
MFNLTKWDTPLNSLKDSNANPEMKKNKIKKINAHFLVHNTFGVKKACWSFGMGTKTSDKRVNYWYQFAQNQITSSLVCSCNICGAWMNHMHTRIHKIHHSLDLGEATAFPLIVFSLVHHESYTQMTFFLRLLSQKSHNFLKSELLPRWMHG